MRSFRVLFDYRARLVAAAAGLLLTAVVPTLASAAQLTTRSIELSSSAANESGVKYTVNFTATQGAGAIVLDFCSDSPLIGATCTPPSGFSASSAATSSAGYTITSAGTSTVRLTKTISASDNVSFELTGIHNPTNANPLYARILTYTDDTDASNYSATDPDAAGAHVHKDDGGVAMSITNKIGVSAAVLETMTFCVSGENPTTHVNPLTENCGGTQYAPTLKLGTDNGGVIALDSALVYTGNVYTQISTNASSGAVVSLKSGAAGCGGLIRAGAATPAAGCGIAPAQATDITAGQAKFGVKTATAAGVGTNFNGALQPFGTSTSNAYYSDSVYKLKYNSTDESDGVTSPYGDPLLETAGAPVNNMGMTLTFGASAANNTPAGNYSADLSLIATGTF